MVPADRAAARAGRVGRPVGHASKDLLAAVRCRLDHALRVDLLAAAASGLTPGRVGGVFAVRPGGLEVTDDDLGWLRAWRIAAEIAGVVAGPVWAICRHGWVDVGANQVTRPPRHRLRNRGRDRIPPEAVEAYEDAESVDAAGRARAASRNGSAGRRADRPAGRVADRVEAARLAGLAELAGLPDLPGVPDDEFDEL